MLRFSAAVAVLAASVVLASCAKKSQNITASYVSPLQYAHFSCDQLTAEAASLSSRVAAASSAQDSAAQRDKIATGVGIVLFWPALFFLAAGDDGEELARLKGEFQAVEREAIAKRCGLAAQIQTSREAAQRVPAEAPRVSAQLESWPSSTGERYIPPWETSEP